MNRIVTSGSIRIKALTFIECELEEDERRVDEILGEGDYAKASAASELFLSFASLAHIESHPLWLANSYFYIIARSA